MQQNRNTKTLFDASLYSTPQGEPMEVGRDESEELFQDSQYESVQRSFQTPKSSKLTNGKSNKLFLKSQVIIIFMYYGRGQFFLI